MAASQPSGGDRLREELTCSICLDYFTDPVSIECGHNYCRPCITQQWGVRGAASQCPQCRAACPLTGLRPNRELRNIVEQVITMNITLQRPPEAEQCPRHQQRLQLFCETDQRPICVVCDRSKEHRDHAVVPVEEAAQEYKVALYSCISQLKKELADLQGWAAEERKTSSYLQENFKNQTGKILRMFDQLQQFLDNEKKKLLNQLKSDHESNMKSVQKKVSELQDQKTTHIALITDIEATCKKQEVELLKDMQSLLNRCDNVKAQKPVDDLKVVQTLQRAEHADLQDKLMELKDTFPGLTEFWRQIKIYEREVTLDPHTAYRWLVLSEDRRTVRYGSAAQDLPDTPQRYDTTTCVLGQERLSSGRHYWEVEVGDKTEWDLGVCDQSAHRKGAITETSENGYWAVNLRDGGKYSASTSPWTLLTTRAPLRVVGLFLDCEVGQLSVYNAQDRSLIYTFSGISLPRTLRPFFCPSNDSNGKNAGALRVLPPVV